MKIKEVLSALERFAPLPLQEGWDNSGLQVGLTEAEVSGALLCLDVNERIIDEAMDKGCNLVVSHHPLLFRGLKTISDADYVYNYKIWGKNCGHSSFYLKIRSRVFQSGLEFTI